MSIDQDKQDKPTGTDGESAPDAESTHYHSHPGVLPRRGGDTRRRSDAFFPSAKSMRLSARPSRGGMTLRLALPAVLALLATFIVFSIAIQRRVLEIRVNDIKNDAANFAFSSSIWARRLLLQQEKFLAEHPGFRDSSEWLNGSYWLVANGVVDEKDWVEATGFELNEYAPLPAIKRASEKVILGPLTDWMNSPGSPGESFAVQIVGSDGNAMASAVGGAFRQDLSNLRAIPPHSPESFEAEGIRIAVDHIDSLGAEPLIRAMAYIYSPAGSDRFLGAAVVVARTRSHLPDQRSLLPLAFGLIVVLTTFMAAVCWYAARRITRPMRRLAADMQAMAEGDYSRRTSLDGPDEIGLLAQAFNSMAERLRVARANEKETSRLESDLAIARSIQNNLLPLQTPRVRGLDIHTSYRPAREIGGDYFDFLPIDGRHMGIVVADASGKSIPAALVMSTTRAILRFVAPGGRSAAETLTRVNAILSVDIPKGMFVTAYYVVLDPLDNTMLCASAGHTPLLLARGDGTVELLNPGGIALGFDNGPIFQRAIREQRIKLQAGDRVLLYTDGVVECVNPANEEYSDRRLREFLRRNRQMSSHDFVGALLADLDRHRGTAEMRDDTTIVTFKIL